MLANVVRDRAHHRRLSRTLSGARWSEYEQLLRTASELGWAPMSLEQWILGSGPQGRVLILRHDVDQHPAAAVRMARIEARAGVAATWYFRWRTSSPRAIETIRALGGSIGFHYETLTRMALERGLSADQIEPELVAAARDELRREVAAFDRRFGPLQSISAHGDTRAPGISNQILMRGRDPSELGVAFDANEALSRHRLGLWLTDRSAPDGRWEGNADAAAALRDGDAPILCLTHPNNWCSGASLWSDRIGARALPSHDRNGASPLAIRTGTDRPPAQLPATRGPGPVVADPRLRTAAPLRPFAPVAEALRREIVRDYYDRGARLTSEAALRTLDTNSSLAEARAVTLERVLAAAGEPSLRGRDVLDVGAGFGALALVFATRGARVTALDRNEHRLRLGARIGAEHGLELHWLTGSMTSVKLGHDLFDVIVMNNSFCYIVDRADRRAVLERMLRALRPGGLLVIRNPNRLQPVDQFTRLPLVGLLAPNAARRVSAAFGIERSHVRLLSTRAARNELSRAGFTDVRSVAPAGRAGIARAFATYQHLIGRRPLR